MRVIGEFRLILASREYYRDNSKANVEEGEGASHAAFLRVKQSKNMKIV